MRKIKLLEVLRVLLYAPFGIVCGLFLVGANENVGKSVKCPGVAVDSVEVLVQQEREVLLETKEDGSNIKPALLLVSSQNMQENAVTVVAVGPILGSMDSRIVTTDLTCTSKGVMLTATIERSADYHGGVHKNVLWRPRLEAAVVRRIPEVIFQVTWKMRLATGVELDHAQTPPYPDQRYPLTLTKTIRRPR